MVDLSNIGRNLNADPLISSTAAQAAGKSNKIKQIKSKIKQGRGIGLEDIPEESPYVPVKDISPDEEAQELEQTEGTVETSEVQESQGTLENIDYELAEVQAMIKKLVVRKIQLADKHDDRKHELLVSAFEDCKNAYLKIKAIRDNLA